VSVEAGLALRLAGVTAIGLEGLLEVFIHNKYQFYKKKK
jgi:hypothetical protein